MTAKLPDKAPKPPKKGGKAEAGAKAGTDADPRVAKIVACLDGFGLDREQNLHDLAQVVGDIVGAQCITFRVPHGDDYVITVGWRLA